MGVGWAVALHLLGWVGVLPAHLLWVTLTSALVMTDLEHKLIPNRMLYPGTAITAALLAAGSLLDQTPGRLAGALSGAALCLVGMGLLAALGKGALGMGDVKLSALLGLLCGYQEDVAGSLGNPERFYDRRRGCRALGGDGGSPPSHADPLRPGPGGRFLVVPVRRGLLTVSPTPPDGRSSRPWWPFPGEPPLRQDYPETLVIIRSPRDWTGRLLGPPVSSSSLATCSVETVLRPLRMYHSTGSWQGGVVSEPRYR